MRSMCGPACQVAGKCLCSNCSNCASTCQQCPAIPDKTPDAQIYQLLGLGNCPGNPTTGQEQEEQEEQEKQEQDMEIDESSSDEEDNESEEESDSDADQMVYVLSDKEDDNEGI